MEKENSIKFKHMTMEDRTEIQEFQKVEEKPGVTQKTLEMLWNGIFMALYADYDTQKDFYPQFEVNVTKILCIFAELERCC